MAGLINDLLDVLNEQAENYENLLALSREKHEVLVQNDVKSLQKITNVENIIVGNNQRLEKKRIKITGDISTVLGKENTDMTLALLAQLIQQQDEHPSLVNVMHRLRTAVEDLKLVNERNKSMLEFSMDYVDFTMNLVRGAVSDGIPAGFDSSINTPDAGRSTLFNARQ